MNTRLKFSDMSCGYEVTGMILLQGREYSIHCKSGEI